MSKIESIVIYCSRAASHAARLLLAAMVILVILQIILRNYFLISTNFIGELIGFGLAAITFLALSDTFLNKKHIRVQILHQFTNSRTVNILEIFASLLTLIVLTILSWFIGHKVYEHWSHGIVTNSIAEIPLWIPESIVLLGLFILWLSFASHILSVSRNILHKPLNNKDESY